MNEATPPFAEMQRAWLVQRDDEDKPDFGILLVVESAAGELRSVAIWKLNDVASSQQ